MDAVVQHALANAKKRILVVMPDMKEGVDDWLFARERNGTNQHIPIA